jgi:hypothetical protein
MRYLKGFINEYMDYMEMHTFDQHCSAAPSILNRRKKLNRVLLETKNPPKVMKLLQKPKAEFVQCAA